jgi:hypothetical protein
MNIEKIFVMSDVHSFYDAMMTALDEKGFDKDNPTHHIVICGDLFDRGPDAVKLFEFIKEMSEQGRLTYVCGNHEDLLFECANEIRRGRGVSHHHISNGTFDTICQFTGMSKYDLCFGPLDKAEYEKKIMPLLDFINLNTVDYAEFADYIFVHGWIPCDPVLGNVADDWDLSTADWEGARWINGMHAWAKGAKLPGKTIVCGHFHSSWGHSHLHLDRKEFPQKNREDWQKSFEPFVDEGIIAIDACTAYTGIVNCLVLEA